MFLLENGFNVTGVDFSSNALAHLETLANLKGYLVNTKQVDLSKPDSLNDIGIFDNIVINHYRLNKEQLENIKNHITDNGTLFICGFGHKHRTDSKIRKEDLIYPTDLEYIHKSFDLIKYIETQDDRGLFVTYIFKSI